MLPARSEKKTGETSHGVISRNGTSSSEAKADRMAMDGKVISKTFYCCTYLKMFNPKPKHVCHRMMCKILLNFMQNVPIYDKCKCVKILSFEKLRTFNSENCSPA